jgi:hypothetical protein
VRESDKAPERVTIIKEGNSGTGIVLGVLGALAIALLAYFLLSDRGAVDPSDASIAAAADKVGTAADKVGNAVDDAAQRIR